MRHYHYVRFQTQFEIAFVAETPFRISSQEDPKNNNRSMFDNGSYHARELHTTRLRALLKGLCPRCRTGKIYHRRLTMFERCSVCGLKYEREQGYFLGAMGVSYLLGLSVLAALLVVLSYGVFPQWHAYKTIPIALVIYLPLLPLLVRAARVLWIHFDRLVDPA